MEKSSKYINVFFEKGKRVILDPGGAEEISESKDYKGNVEAEFNFYRHFHGRDWDYRNTSTPIRR